MSDAAENGRASLFSCWSVGVALALVVIVAAIAIPGYRTGCRYSNESAAIGSLKTIATAQSIFREGDKEKDGNLDYGMLSELSSTQLVDAVLGSGTKNLYVFQAAYSPTTGEFFWWATAQPTARQLEVEPGSSRIFANQAGILYRCDPATPLLFDRDTCAINTTVPNVRPIGR